MNLMKTEGWGGTRGLKFMIVAALLAANLFVLGLSGYSLYQGRQQREWRAQVYSQNIAQAIEGNLSRSIEKIDLALKALADDFERHAAGGGLDRKAVEALLARYEAWLPEAEAIRVAGADGRVLFGKGFNPEDSPTWADRDYFVHLRDHPEAGLQISKPRLGRISKRMIVGFSRRYNGADGRFAGVISAPVALDRIVALLSSFDVGHNGFIALRDADLDLVARYPASADSPAAIVGNNNVSPELRSLVQSGTVSATYRTGQTADGIERTISLRRIGQTGLLVVAGVASEDYLADWRIDAYRTGAGVFGLMLLSFLSGWLVLHLLDRIARASRSNELFLHHASDGIHILDQDAKVIQASDCFCAMLGYGRDEVIGMDMLRWEAGLPPDRLADEIFPEVLKQNKAVTFETRHRRKDGSQIDVEVNAVGFDLAGRRCVFASSRDIGEKKRQQQALRESEARLRQSEERYRLLLGNSPVGILHYDTHLIVTYANERFAEILQVPHDYLMGLDCGKLRDPVAAQYMRLALAGENSRYEGPYQTSYGNCELWISMACSPVVNDKGEILGGMGIVEDITERKRIEAAERRQREGLAKLNEVAALSHLPLPEQLQRVLTIAAGHFGLEFGIVGRVAGADFHVVSQVSPPDTLGKEQILPLASTCCDITLRQNAVVAIDDLGASPFAGSPCCLASGLAAYIGAPVYVAGEVYGTVSLSSRQAYHREFDDGDKEFIGLLARWAGSAIERDQARRSLAASEARLQAIVDNEPECVLVLGPKGDLLQINPVGLGFLEVESIGEVNARGLSRFIVPEHRQAFVDLSRRVLAGETDSLEFMIDGKRGARRWLDAHAAPLRDGGGTVLALLAVMRDITERKRADSQLRLAANVFSHAHEGIMICDADQTIIDVNPTFCEITGYRREEIVGQTPRILKSGRQTVEFYRAMWEAIELQGHWGGEIWNRRKDGEVYAERLTISGVRDDEGQVAYYIATFSDISVFKEHQAQLEYLAHYDALTQLPNRTLLADRMVQALAHARRQGSQLAVCYLDLDGFKEINDRHGHDAGDALLIEVARRLRDTLRGGDTIARLGGDEFVLLLAGISSLEECDHAAVRILRSVAAPVRIRERECTVSGSIGIALFPDDDSDPDTLLRHADQAMYAAKQAGKNRYQLYDASRDQRARSRQGAAERIRMALERGEFLLHYQPIVDMLRGTVLAFEGLVRWQHPERGLLLPEEFLSLVEGTELDVALGRWVLAEGVRQLAAWRRMGLPQSVSLNVSATHLLSPGFADEAVALLSAYPELGPHALEIEIMEAAAIQDLEAAIAIFQRCRKAGIDIALDDFGTGYSSLSFFRRLPVDVLKVDQIFVQSVLGNAEDMAIVDSVINLTRAFERKLVAEGVENAEICMLLLGMGCHVGQGYGIARPMPPEAIPAWVADFVPHPEWSSPATHFSREELPLFLAELEHRTWVRQMEAWLNGGAAPPPALDGCNCRFGRWYDGEGQERYGRFESYRPVGQSHQAVHALARELVDLRRQGRGAEAQARLGELLSLRDSLVADLANLQAEALVERL